MAVKPHAPMPEGSFECPVQMWEFTTEQEAQNFHDNFPMPTNPDGTPMGRLIPPIWILGDFWVLIYFAWVAYESHRLKKG